MTADAIIAATFLAALGCALIGGVFFAFSTFVMRALAGLPTPAGMSAMQAINITVLNRWFLGTFLGTALLCLGLAAAALVQWHQPGAGFLLAGSLLYLVGTVLVTGTYHVPRNNLLAGVDPVSAVGATTWAGYVAGWTVWNHVRTFAALAAAAALIGALLLARPNAVHHAPAASTFVSSLDVP